MTVRKINLHLHSNTVIYCLVNPSIKNCCYTQKIELNIRILLNIENYFEYEYEYELISTFK